MTLLSCVKVKKKSKRRKGFSQGAGMGESISLRIASWENSLRQLHAERRRIWISGLSVWSGQTIRPQKKKSLMSFRDKVRAKTKRNRSGSMGCSVPISMKKLSTGEPYAGEPHVRFGGRGSLSFPYLYRLRRDNLPYCFAPAINCHIIVVKRCNGATSPVTLKWPYRLLIVYRQWHEAYRFLL